MPEAREQLAKTPLEDSLLPREQIIEQAKYRLIRAAKNPDIDMHQVRVTLQYLPYARRTGDASVQEDVVEFYSFFVAVLAASKEPILATSLAKVEAQRAKICFLRERPETMLSIISQSIGLPVRKSPNRDSRYLFYCPMEDYLMAATKYDLMDEGRWKLANLPLQSGNVYFEQNMIQDLFASLANVLMISGMKAVRTRPAPPYVRQLVADIQPFVPRPAPRQLAGYAYVEELLKYPITDGRHRTAWLILAPYFVSIKGYSEEAAYDAVSNYLNAPQMNRFIRYQVKRVSRNSLLPPTLNKLKTDHPDLYALLPKQVTARYSSARK